MVCSNAQWRCTVWWLAQFDLRNGAVRKKYDSLKYTLKKLEVRQGHHTKTLDMSLSACGGDAIILGKAAACVCEVSIFRAEHAV